MKIEKINKPGRERKPVRAVAMDLSGPDGRRVVMSAAKRVIATHSKVIKALADR